MHVRCTQNEKENMSQNLTYPMCAHGQCIMKRDKTVRARKTVVEVLNPGILTITKPGDVHILYRVCYMCVNCECTQYFLIDKINH